MRAAIVWALSAALAACSGGGERTWHELAPGGRAVVVETVLFSDNFNRSDGSGLGPNWTVLAGSWLTDTRANADRDALDRAVVRGIACADCRIDARLVGFGSPENGFTLRETPSGDRYELVLLSNGHVQIRRWRSGSLTVLDDAPSGIADLGNWATFAFTAQGAGPVSLTASVNGSPKLAVTDASALALTTAGTAGLTSQSAGVWFDDFTLTALAAGGTDAGTSDAGVDAGGIAADAGADGGGGTPDAGADAGPGGGADGGGADAGADAGSGGEPAPGTVLFSDDFNRNDASGLGPNWTVVAGFWITDSRANADRDQLDRAAPRSVTCADCRIDVRLVGFGSPENGFTLRETPSGDRYDLVLLSSGRVQIRRWRSGSATILGDAPSGIPDLGNWATFAFAAQGAGPVVLTASVNGTIRLSTTDVSAQAITGAGSAGLTARSAGVWFDDFKLTATGTGSGGGAADGGAPDAGSDAGVPDAGTDAGVPDAGTDAGVDAGTDGGAADGGTPSGAVLFFDDFNRNDSSGLGPSWAIAAGAFITDTRANADRTGLDQAYVKGVICADCRIDARVVGFGTETALTLRGNPAAPADRYDLTITSSGRLQIRRWRAGASTVLGDVASGIPDLGNWASLTFSASGLSPVTLAATVDGVTRLTVTDGSAAALTSAGVAGMTATAAGVWFDDFKLTALGPTSGVDGGTPDAGSDGGAPDAGSDGGTPDAGSDGGTPDAGTDGGLPGGNDWPFYRHDLAGTGASNESLSAAQAPGLHLAFQLDIPYGSDANPVVSGNTLYVAAGEGSLIAFDARTGQRKWSQQIGLSSKGPCAPYQMGPVGAAAVAGTMVYAAGGNGRVYAFDKEIGTPIWSTQLADTAANQFIWSSVFPVNGRLYVGIANETESSVCDENPGRVVSLDGANGAVLGTWWADRDHGNGGGVWTSPAFDVRTNRLFVTTGTVADHVDPTTKPWQQAFVAIDPISMETLDSFQPVPTPFSADYEFGASPTLFDASDGRHLIAATNKNGYVYALDRDALASGVVWTYQISGPGTSPDLGESSIVSAAYAHGRLFVAGARTTDGYQGAIAALDPTTGSQLWKMHPDGFVLPALSAVGEVIVAAVSRSADKTGAIYVLEQTTGNVLYTFPTANRLFAQPTWANGMLYVVDDVGTLFALRP